MNLKHLTDECLWLETIRLVQKERDGLAVILHHLKEINRRRLFGDHPSLHVYACRELKYSDDQTQRRTSAMRVMSELPEIEPSIRAGDISLTHIGLAKSLFELRHEDGKPLSRAEKLGVFEAMAGKSTRHAEKLTREMAGGAPPTREIVKPLGFGRYRLTVEIQEEDVANIKTLRGRLAHARPKLTIGELIGYVLKRGIEAWDRARRPRRKTKEDSKAAIRRAVFQRDGGACVRCGSTHAVEIDHIKPRAMEGEDTPANLRLLCRTCNQRAAVEWFGADKMEPFIAPAAPRVIVL